LKKLLNKKGVSTIIATLLTINIVIVLFVIVLSVSLPSLGLMQSQAQGWYLSKEDSSRERLSLEMIYFNSTEPKTIVMYVRNIGEIDVEISHIYVNGTSQNNTSPSLPGSYPIYVDVENAESVTDFIVSYDWTVGTIYNIKVITVRGNRAASIVQAP
jgi:FlaG/FlaF family flagellin (archaellin)